ncbi:MAG TPA: site-2 protease family protein, partial [Planctomycetota bacterium]|nr:site-2 protease family protein [Planctomycetota bacterium]
SPKNLGGVLTIGKVSYQASSMGWTKLLFFLCMLSVNLAFLNVLPIPLLDGGHLFFLLIEGIKGSPVSERIMGYSQLVGLVLILSLMVYVTYQDILRIL